jgi:hypothetical protein
MLTGSNNIGDDAAGAVMLTAEGMLNNLPTGESDISATSPQALVPVQYGKQRSRSTTGVVLTYRSQGTVQVVAPDVQRARGVQSAPPSWNQTLETQTRPL